jgi:hypothetical protein
MQDQPLLVLADIYPALHGGVEGKNRSGQKNQDLPGLLSRAHQML